MSKDITSIAVSFSYFNFSWKSEVFGALWGHNLKQSKLKMQDTVVNVCGMTTLIGGSKNKTLISVQG